MTTTSDYILYYAKRLLDAEAKAADQPTTKNIEKAEKRRREFNEAVSKLSIKQGNLFN